MMLRPFPLAPGRGACPVCRMNVGTVRTPVRPVRPARSSLAVRAASTLDKSTPRPGEKKGFVEEMRFVAMKLHTKDQAPKEGGREAPKPMKQWQPSVQGYLNFLAESKRVYETLERIVAEQPEFAGFRSTGLERSEALARDIDWFKEHFGAEPQPAGEDSPGQTYSRKLAELAESDPPAFICHFYNVYFAHTAGGRMIGSKVAGMILDGRELEFYKYEGDYKPLLNAVRDTINQVAAGWSREEKDRCLQETEQSFKFSGELLRLIAS